MSKKNKLLQRLGIVMLLMLTLCFGFVPDTKAAAAKDTTVEASIASTPVSKAAPAPYLTTDTMTFDKGRASQTTFLVYGSAKKLTPSASWISVSYGSGITVTVTANSSSNTRNGKVTVLLTTGKSLTITVKQYGMLRVKSDGSYATSLTMPGVYSLELPRATVDAKVTAESAGAITVTDSYTWISTSVVGKDIYIYLAPNYNTNVRRGSITISNGVSSTSLTIIQRAFIPDPYYYSKDWTNYFGYYDWEQNVRKSTYLSSVKSAYNKLVKTDFTGYILPVAGKKDTYTVDTSKDSVLITIVTNLVNATAKLYEIRAPRVALIFEDKSVCGAYDRDTDTIYINRFQALQLVDLADTIFHEMRHKWQWETSKTNGSLIQYLFFYNQIKGKYISPNTNYTNYRNQVVEADAFYVGAKMLSICQGK